MLAPETRKVWSALKGQPLLDGFVLVGGTALALHIGHRISEDLDFAYTRTTLPRQRLERLLQLAPELGLSFQRNDDPAAVEDFVNAGLDLRDAQQDLIVNGTVKVSFFVPAGPLAKIIGHHGREGLPRVATVDELFAAKALLTADRSKTRDWYDLYVLMSDHGYTAEHFIAAFYDNGAKLQLDTALTRLCAGKPQPDDESYLAVSPTPPDLPTLRAFFLDLREKIENLLLG